MIRKFCFFFLLVASPFLYIYIYSFLFSLFNSQSDEDAGSDDDGADIPSVVLAAPTTPAPPVTSAASAAPPAAPLVVEEVHEILSGQYYFNTVGSYCMLLLSLNHHNVMFVLVRFSSSNQVPQLRYSSCTTW